MSSKKHKSKNWFPSRDKGSQETVYYKKITANPEFCGPGKVPFRKEREMRKP